jgi:hypothetical protein
MTVPLQMHLRAVCTVSFDPKAGTLRKVWLREGAGHRSSGPFFMFLFTIDDLGARISTEPIEHLELVRA